MSGHNFLVDTNFLIYLLNGHSAIKPFLKNNYFISEITEMEMLGVKDLPAHSITIRKELLSNCYIVNFNSDVKEITIKIKQQVTIRLPDAIIAATSMYMGFPLITADRQFTKVSGLDCLFLKV